MLSPCYVDTSEALERRIPLERAGFMLKRLSAGDVQFPESGGGTVLIENKKIYQLLEDMSTGQLVSQCRRMVDACDYPILMIEGAFQYLASGQLLGYRYTIEQLRNQLLSLQELGLYIERTADASDTVQRCLELAERYSKEQHPSIARHPSGNDGIAVLAHIPGIGTAKAKALLLSAPDGSLRTVLSRSAEQLSDAEGIGPKLARRIHEFCGKDFRDEKR